MTERKLEGTATVEVGNPVNLLSTAWQTVMLRMVNNETITREQAETAMDEVGTIILNALSTGEIMVDLTGKEPIVPYTTAETER